MTVSSSWRIDRFVRRLASSEPAPGGGSAAALAGSLGVSLGAMVGRILLSRPKRSASAKSRFSADIRSLDQLSARFLKLIREDAEAYRALIVAQRSQRGVGQARKRAIQAPLDICITAEKGLKLVRGFLPSAGPYLGSDLKAARALLRGAFDSASLMVTINLQGPDPAGRNAPIRKQLASLQKKMRSL